MTRSKGWLFAAMASTLVATIAGQEPPRFRSDVRTVVMYAVHGRAGRLVPNLSQDDFEILEDGQPRPIASFSSETVPITATLMLDMSDSMPLRLSPDVSHLANDTGGAHFQLGKGTDLAATFDQVVTELRSQYALGFIPERFDEQTHRLDLRMRPSARQATRDAQSVIVRDRAAYPP